jgi:DNA-binding NarL/FixJ family response regulator
MAEGRSNAAIAGRLFVTEKAVSTHTNSIFTKLDLGQDSTTTAESSPCWPTCRADAADCGKGAR